MDEPTGAADRGILRNRAFLALWAAQILSQVAANATTFALIVLVGELTKSNTSSSILILLAILPAVVFGVFAGVVVDRTDRKRVLVVTNALRAGAVLPLLALGESVTVAYVVNFLVAAITVFFVPAEAATIPSIVRKRDLLVANSLFTFTFNGAFLVGFIILAPVVIALSGYQALFIVVASMFAGAALLCLTVPSVAPVTAAGRIGVDVAGAAVAQTLGGVAEAFAYLRAHPPVVWSLVYIALTYMLVAVAGALAPGFVREVLGLGEKNVVVLVAPAGLGVVAGLGALNVIGGSTARDRDRASRHCGGARHPRRGAATRCALPWRHRTDRGLPILRRAGEPHRVRVRDLVRVHHGAVDDPAAVRSPRADPRPHLRRPQHARVRVQLRAAPPGRSRRGRVRRRPSVRGRRRGVPHRVGRRPRHAAAAARGVRLRNVTVDADATD